MAGQDDDFGEFSSAFPIANNLTSYHNASSSFDNHATGTGIHTNSNEMNNFTAFAAPNPAGDTCKFPDDTSFDAFASCPVSVDTPGFADLSQFNMAEFPIPIPSEGSIQSSDLFTTSCGGVFEIPPLPDDLEFDVGNDITSDQVQVSMNGVPGDTGILPHTTMASSVAAVNSIPAPRLSGQLEQPSITNHSTSLGDDLDKPSPRTEDVSHDDSSEFGEFEASFKQSEEGSLTLGRLQDSSSSHNQRDLNLTAHTNDSEPGKNGNFAVESTCSKQEGTAEQGGGHIAEPQPERKSTVSESLSDDFGEFLSSRTDKEGAVTNKEDHQQVEYQQPWQDDAEKSPGFGGFSAFQQPDPTGGSSTKKTFGDFGTSKSTGSSSEFAADFSKFQSSEPSDFEAFSSSGTDVTQVESSSGVGHSSEFGEFATDDDFGDFSSSSSTTTTFGGFTQPPAASSVGTISPPTPSKLNHSEVSVDVLGACFPSNGPSTSSLTSPVTQLQPKEESSESVWRCLQKCVDFTVPLYKWDKSYMQDHYYGALKIDTSLVRPGALPIFASSMAPSDLHVEGQSAADDLMEAFGFETGLEPTTATSPMHSSSEFTLNSEETAPALLDLSLPSSPSAETKNASIASGPIATDLLGLDLNPKASQQLTSIQQLLLNERLVVNRSTWMDSQLLELEGDNASHPPAPSTSTPPSSPNLSTHSIPRQRSVEQQLLQLGLDVRKTTFAAASTSQKELSLSARTVLGRLPDLSFMFSETIVERRR